MGAMCMFFLRRCWILNDTNYSVLQSAQAKNFGALALARRADQRFHMVQIALQRLSPCCREPVLRFGQPPLKRLRAHDLIGFFQPAAVHPQPPGRLLPHAPPFLECHRTFTRPTPSIPPPPPPT